jgi:phenylpropionate dioxygenase-like ring-hydroxylating dioxygenase large terminal subunit
MVTQAENERMTRIEGDAPMGWLIREHTWVPFALSTHLVHDEGPLPVRLLGESYVAFRAEDGRVGFLDELCPHRRASLTLARLEGNCLQCIYHGWTIDVSGRVVDAPTQLVRPERFAANVDVAHFPVHEAGGIAWVWLGGGDAPPFPELPFADSAYSYLCQSRVPCNWLQGIEGTIDSVHVGMLHQTWIREAAKMAEHSNLTFALDQPPRYETEAAPYGMRAAALRTTSDGGTYVRITEHLLPFVTVVPVGQAQPRSGSVFVISPVDDTHHLLFFGYFGDTPHSAKRPDEICMEGEGYEPDPHDYTRLRGSRENRWGQDRALMGAGHWTGFGRSLLEEDVVIQTSMGPILDRTKEHLSSSDVAVAHARRMLLDALDAVADGALPPGSVRSSEPVRLPNPIEALLGDGDRWEDLSLDPAAT